MQDKPHVLSIRNQSVYYCTSNNSGVSCYISITARSH